MALKTHKDYVEDSKNKAKSTLNKLSIGDFYMITGEDSNFVKVGIWNDPNIEVLDIEDLKKLRDFINKKIVKLLTQNKNNV